LQRYKGAEKFSASDPFAGKPIPAPSLEQVLRCTPAPHAAGILRQMLRFSQEDRSRLLPALS